MFKLERLFDFLLLGYKPTQVPFREKLISAMTAGIAIAVLSLVIHRINVVISAKLLVLASMGASAFVLFVIPHSPLAQPWPALGGHLISAFIGVACARWIPHVELAAGAAVLLSIFTMHYTHCLHPPSAATSMIAVIGGPEVHAMGWQFAYELVSVNALVLLLMALVLNNIAPGRRYPMRHEHHPHHAAFTQQHPQLPEINEEDFKWALTQIDGFIDVNEEDLVDLYEFAAEHAQKRMQKS